jgi:hypothetical protein
MPRLLFILFIYSLSNHAQPVSWESASAGEIAQAYRKACHWFTHTSSYAFKLKYSSFNSPYTDVPLETSEGFYKKTANRYISEGIGIRTIQTQDLKIIIDTTEKTITLMDPGRLNPDIASVADLEVLLANTRALKKCKQGKGIRYRMDFNPNAQFEAYEFLLNERGILERLTYYYSEQAESSEDWRSGENNAVRVKPRMEILFHSHEVPARIKESEFTTTFVVSFDKDKAHLNPFYNHFRLLDYRISKKK